MTKRMRYGLRFIAAGLAVGLAATVIKMTHPASVGKPAVPPTAHRFGGPATARMAATIQPGMTQEQVQAMFGKPQMTNREINEVNRRLLIRAGKTPSKTPPDPTHAGWFYKTSDGGTVGIGFHNGVVTLVTTGP